MNPLFVFNPQTKETTYKQHDVSHRATFESGFDVVLNIYGEERDRQVVFINKNGKHVLTYSGSMREVLRIVRVTLGRVNLYNYSMDLYPNQDCHADETIERNIQ